MAPAEIGRGEVGPGEAGPTEVGPTEVGPAEVGPAEVGLAEVGLAEVDRVEVVLAEIDRVIFHGKRGELRQRYREGQEDQLGALGLVVNLVVLWNTIYMDAAVKQLSAEGYEVQPEDNARLSPLGHKHKHVNMLGRYAFALPDTVARGELRPLRDSRTAGVDEA